MMLMKYVKIFQKGKKVDLLEFFNYLEKYNIYFTEEELLNLILILMIYYN